MSRRIRLLAITLAVVAAVVLIIALRRTRSPTRATGSAPAPSVTPRIAGKVTLRGTVRDAEGHTVAAVEVLFRNAAGDAIATTRSDGTYAITLAAGTYRVAVRGDQVLSVALADRTRLPELPSSEVAGIPDEALMLRLDATTDLDGVDLDVVATWRISGRVLDPDGMPVPGAIVRANPQVHQPFVTPIQPTLRPVLGTDSAISDRDGRFLLRVPPGSYAFVAAHPAFAGVHEVDQETVNGTIEHTIFLARGCIIAGRVLDANGEPAGDGAIERQIGFTERDFDPSGRIEADGTFRWVTTMNGPVTLRAWPWASPPSAAETFACSDGAVFDKPVLRLPAEDPDLEGVLVDARGEPVPFAYLDVSPLDLGGIGQQERTDGEGAWRIYRMPPGRYAVRAHAPDRGFVAETIRAPERGIKLVLGGLGRLEGTTTLLESGSFTLTRIVCEDARRVIPRSLDRRLVVVRGGRFAIDDLPACNLVATASWRDQDVQVAVSIPMNGTATTELALGSAR